MQANKKSGGLLNFPPGAAERREQRTTTKHNGKLFPLKKAEQLKKKSLKRFALCFVTLALRRGPIVVPASLTNVYTHFRALPMLDSPRNNICLIFSSTTVRLCAPFDATESPIVTNQTIAGLFVVVKKFALFCGHKFLLGLFMNILTSRERKGWPNFRCFNVFKTTAMRKSETREEENVFFDFSKGNKL